MAATHNHEAPDTMGQWGPGLGLPLSTGRDPRFIRRLYTETAAGIDEAVSMLRPARIEAAVLDVGVEGLAVSDSRAPYIFDDNVPVVRLIDTQSEATIATLLSFANHPEVLWSENPYLTSDYPHYVRRYIEEGLSAVVDPETQMETQPALEGLGGVTLFFAGAVGGLINPGRGGAKDYAGRSFDEDRFSFAAADAVGQTLAAHVLGAAHRGQLNAVDVDALRFAQKQFLAPLDNTLLLLAGTSLRLIRRDLYNAIGNGFSWTPQRPMLLTEVVVVRLGPVTFFTAPGEAFPESLVGGYPYRTRAGTPIVGDVEERRVPAQCDAQGLPVRPEVEDANNPCLMKEDQRNPPDFSLAPEGPYLYDQIPGDYPFFIGLGQDALGYLVPAYDYKITDYFSEAPGDHYEETVGINATIETVWVESVQELVEVLK